MYQPPKFNHTRRPHRQAITTYLVVKEYEDVVNKPFEGVGPTRQSTTKIIGDGSDPGVTSSQSHQANYEDLLPRESITPPWEDDSGGKTKMDEELMKLLFGESGHPVSKVRGETIN